MEVWQEERENRGREGGAELGYIPGRRVRQTVSRTRTACSVQAAVVVGQNAC